MATLTGAEIITKFTNEVEDELDTGYMYQLLNDAKDEIESLLVWEWLKKEHTFTRNSGDTIDTTYALPTPTGGTFYIPISVFDTSYLEYNLIPIEQKMLYFNANYSFYIDYQAQVMHFTGICGGTTTMHLFYQMFSDDITSTTSWAFPSKFHSILPLKMAQMYYAADGGEKSMAWDDRWGKYYEDKLGQMVLWDSQLKLRARGKTRYSQYNPKGINF